MDSENIIGEILVGSIFLFLLLPLQVILETSKQPRSPDLVMVTWHEIRRKKETLGLHLWSWRGVKKFKIGGV